MILRIDHLLEDSVGLQRGDGLVKERQVGDAAVVPPDGIVGGSPAQDDGQGQIHGRPSVIVQHVSHPVCASKRNHNPLWQQRLCLCSACLHGALYIYLARASGDGRPHCHLMQCLASLASTINT